MRLSAPLLALLAGGTSPALPCSQQKPDFAVRLVLSADLAALDRWDGTNVPDFRLAASEGVVRGQAFMVFPFFTGFALDGDGAAEIDVDVRITRPGGGVYHQTKGMQAVRHLAQGRTLLLPVDLVGVSFEPKDKLGQYRVEVVARDRIGKKTARAQQEIELVEYAEGAAFQDVEEFWAWAWSYHQAPDPCRARGSNRHRTWEDST